ncbi:MAG: LysR family transcriptional regulator [Rhodoferax sp.]|uniref:LysR family transcriptional regulator n=1 Tax=Rhodoferax sp. TaxID=50421 RepID=UPI003265D565
MNSEPDWHLYRTFLAVLQERSLSGAARRLALTQPTVTRHLDALEEAMGVTLFLRTQRGLTPTDMALKLAPHAQSLAATAAAMLRLASDRTGEVRGTVRVSASEVVGALHLPPIFAALRRRHPGITIELALSNAVADLLQREADIAVRMTEPLQDALLAKRLPSVELGLYAHRDYLAKRGVPMSMANLAEHDVIGFDTETPQLRGMVRRYPTFSRSAFALRTDSDIAKHAAVRAGFGIGMCQVAVAQRDPVLTRVLADQVSVELGLWIVMHEDLKSSAHCKVVFDALASGLSAL